MLMLLSTLCLTLLLSITSGQICNNPQYNRNYYWKTVSTDFPTSCVNPSDVSDIETLLSEVYTIAELGSNVSNISSVSVRPIGKSFSWSAVGMAETIEYPTNINRTFYFINQTEYRRNYTVDENLKQLTGEAGMRMIDVVEALEKYNLGLVDFGGPMIVNFIGSFNSGTHGKGSRRNPIGAVSRQVIELEIVLPNGTLITANKMINSDYYYANLISMGSLGVITKFVVQAGDFYNLTRLVNKKWEGISNTNFEQIEFTVKNNVSDLIDFADFIYGGYSVFREKFSFQNLYYTNRTDIVPNTYDTLCWNLTEEKFNEFPCTDAYYKATSPVPLEAYAHGANWEAEFYVLKEDFEVAYLAGIKWVISQQFCNPDIWNETKAFHDSFGKPDTDKGEIQINTRWIGPDCTWLSAGYSELCEGGSPMVQIGIYIPGDFVDPLDPSSPTNGVNGHRAPPHLWFFWVTGYYKAIRRAVPSSNPVRVHWGKASLRNHCEIKSSYPKMQDFKDLRKELDPMDIFVNQQVRDKLGLCDECCCTFDTCNKTDLFPEYNNINWQEEDCELDLPATTTVPATTDNNDSDDVSSLKIGLQWILLPLVALLFVMH